MRRRRPRRRPTTSRVPGGSRRPGPACSITADAGMERSPRLAAHPWSSWRSAPWLVQLSMNDDSDQPTVDDDLITIAGPRECPQCRKPQTPATFWSSKGKLQLYFCCCKVAVPYEEAG